MGNQQTGGMKKEAKNVLKNIARKHNLRKQSIYTVYKAMYENIERHYVTDDELKGSMNLWERYQSIEFIERVKIYVKKHYNAKRYYKELMKEDKRESEKRKRKSFGLPPSPKYKTQISPMNNKKHKKEVKEAFKLDTSKIENNNNNKTYMDTLTLAEYCAFMVEMTNASPSKRMRILFDICDDDKSGYLELDDMIDLSNMMFKKIRGDRSTRQQRKKMAYALFNEMDKECTSRITFEAFSKVVMGHPDFHRAVMSIAKPLYNKKYYRSYLKHKHQSHSARSSMRSSRPTSVASNFTIESFEHHGMGGGAEDRKLKKRHSKRKLSRQSSRQSVNSARLSMKTSSSQSLEHRRSKNTLKIDTSPTTKRKYKKASHAKPIKMSPVDNILNEYVTDSGSTPVVYYKEMVH
mmetsp:Transcript_2313/g.3350  ORF Transcript_2313/g.3350 Transcript_2313/m.3350 type:complete len:406 (+) Transcript_2313:26-1243(+)